MTDSRRFRFPRLLIPWSSAFLFASLGCHAFQLDFAGAGKLDKPEKGQTLTTPAKHSFRVAQFVFFSDTPLNQESPVFRDLAKLQDQVYGELQLPSSGTLVNVYLFEDRERYERFMRGKYPELPKRRAFFVAQPHGGVGGGEDLIVYTYWGDHIKEDLRHELTHALLHCVLKDVPLWLDEGLAEYFELPAENQGVNHQHVEHLRHGPDGACKPNLARLEQLSEVQQMAPAEYREAWAWVHWMLRGQPEAKKVLLPYLQQLRVNPKPGPLGPRLNAAAPNLNETLQNHLAKLEQVSTKQ